MASSYLGNLPSNNFVSLKRQVITGNNGSTYTLDHSVASVNDVAIFVNNVRQDPASYSISGTALTLGGTISSSDSCYVIFLGQALQTVTPATGTLTNAMLGETITVSKGGTGLTSGFANGVTMVDQWRLTSSFTGNAVPIASNWERNDTSPAVGSSGSYSSSMSESSGIFSFPSTGIYHVQFHGTYSLSSNTRFIAQKIEVTENNSSFSVDVLTYTSIDQVDGGQTFSSADADIVLDITDISNQKVRFSVEPQTTATQTTGETSQDSTYVRFIRLGDT
tara:strand:- start:17 stop:850 length:834 start_codon:yes stop_codon:yes gene_type:complete